MQILGASVLDHGIEAVAQRSGRAIVIEWATRVLRRHVRREFSLVKEVIGDQFEKKVVSAMQSDGLNEDVQRRILNDWRSGNVKVYLHNAAATAAFLRRAADTMDWIESLPDNDRRIRRIERMSWKDADEAAIVWHEALAKSKFNNNLRMNGVVKAADLEDGAFIGKLVTAKALKTEGSMMGHCVGGYWGRVSSGQTQIYSLRDADGYPHATIELGKTPEVNLDDGSKVRVGTVPRPGVNYLHVTDSNWVAVQVRGKQNKRPLEKYVQQIENWFAQHDIPWVEYGEELPDARPDRMIFVYNVGGIKGVNYTDPKMAHEIACNQIAKHASTPSQRFNFTNLYREMGLHSLHEHHGSPENIHRFIETVTPAVVSGFSKMVKTNSFAVAATRSGITILNKIASKYGLPVDGVNDVMFKSVCDQQDPQARYVKRHLLGCKGIEKALDVVQHILPLAPLALLANGFADRKEASALELIKPHLEESVRVMKKFPDRVHVVQSSYSGVTPDNIRQAYLYCGLASEYADARSNVIQGVKLKLNEIRMSIRKARPSAELTAENINLIRNMLNEGYEARINKSAMTKFGNNSFVVAFEDVKPQPAPCLSADPVVRPSRFQAMRL
jgi:hypothetical protein